MKNQTTQTEQELRNRIVEIIGSETEGVSTIEMQSDIMQLIQNEREKVLEDAWDKIGSKKLQEKGNKSQKDQIFGINYGLRIAQRQIQALATERKLKV